MLTPNARGYDADDVAIIEAISRFRAGGYEEAIGFTVYDTLRYREALAPLVEEEVGCCCTGSPARSTSTARCEIISSGAEPLRELIGAMHSKLLLLAALRALTTTRREPPSRRSPRRAQTPPGSSPANVPNGWR